MSFLQSLIQRVVILTVTLCAASVGAIDFNIPLPKPSLPAIPTPAFLSKPGKKVSDEELKEIEAAHVKRDETRPIADERRETRYSADNSASTETTRAGSAYNPATSASTQTSESNEIDLSPTFAALLPYSMTLGRVVCESNFPFDSVQGLQAEIVQLQIDLVNYLGIPEAREKIVLCLFKDETSYRDFIKTVFPGAPQDRPALYVRQGENPGVLMVQKDDKMIVNIRHEMTHAYLNSTLRHVPIWLDEGLAKYFETPPGERGFRNPYLKIAEENISGFFSSPPSLARLEKLTRVDEMRAKEYRESWSWVHFLIHYSRDTHYLLVRYLATLRKERQAGISTEEAYKAQKKAPMKRLLDENIEGYNEKYVEHFKNWDKRRDSYENARVERGTR